MPIRGCSTIGRMSSGRATTGAVFIAGIGLLMLALNAIAVPKSPTFQTIGACLLFAGVLAALLVKRRQDS
jgi:hypothetical protein